MLEVADSSSFSPELTSEDKLLRNEETDKNSSLPLPTTKRVLKKLQDLSLLSGNKALVAMGGNMRVKRQGNPKFRAWQWKLEVLHWFFHQLAFSYWASHVKYFVLEQQKR